jgi:hypothetical protein
LIQESKIQSWFLKTAGAIVGSLGTAGAMVVIGSAVLWVRFKEAGIPPVQAVSVQPKQEALVQGAETTIFFVFAAVAVVALLYILDLPTEEDPDKPVEEKPEQKEEKGKKKGKKKEEAQAVVDGSAPRPIQPRTKKCIRLLPVLGVAWLISTSLNFGAVFALALLAAGLTGACLWIGHRADKNFWALAAAVFASIIVFAGASTYAITQAQKYVQAVAILRGSDDVGLTGYFVAATDTRIYFANAIGVEGSTKPARKPLQSVKVSDSVTYSIGPLENQADATERASSMVKKLIADREASGSKGTEDTAANFPAWVSSEVAATFGASVEIRSETPDDLCLMRYYSFDKGIAKGVWWTSCAEAEGLASIDDVRSRFALPRRFQASYDRRVRVQVPAKTKLNYVEGTTAPQCGGAGKEPCGYRYPGGGTQYWISTPEQLGNLTEECKTTAPDEDSKWHSCKGAA